MFGLCWIIFVEWYSLYFKWSMFFEWLCWKWDLLWFFFFCLTIFFRSIWWKKKKNWIGCNSNCSTCYGPLSNNCLSCLEPKVLLEETCADSCPSNYVIVNQTNSCQGLFFSSKVNININISKYKQTNQNNRMWFKLYDLFRRRKQ